VEYCKYPATYPIKLVITTIARPYKVSKLKYLPPTNACKNGIVKKFKQTIPISIIPALKLNTIRYN
jgi:hypothetical protein